MTNIMQSATVQYGSISLEVVHDPAVILTVDNFDSHAFLTYKGAEDLLGWRQYSASEKLESKQAKALQSEDSQPRKNLVADSRGKATEMGLIPFGLFQRIILWQSEKGNPKAKAIVAAGFKDSVRSIILEQVTGKAVPLVDRLRKIDEDRDQFYKQYAAGISDEEWLIGSGVGGGAGLDMAKTSHWAAFSADHVPDFLSRAVARGQDADEILEELMLKYQG